MQNEDPVIADLRKVFIEKEFSLDKRITGWKLFNVTEPVRGVDSPFTVFRAERILAYRISGILVVNNFIAKVIQASWGSISIACYMGDIFYGQPEFDHFPPEKVDPSGVAYQSWLNSVVMATLKHSEKVRCDLEKPIVQPPSVAGD